MTSTTVSDAIVLPQSTGTGLGSNVAQADAAVLGLLARYRGDGGYVDTKYASGLQFQNHDAAGDTVEIAPGACFVQDQSSSTSNSRGSGGNPQAESSTSSGFDVELPAGHVYLVLIPTAVQISVNDSQLNEVHIDLDVTSNNGVTVEHDGSSTASPGSTSLKLGETNPDDSSADTRANDKPSITASAVSTEQATIDGGKAIPGIATTSSINPSFGSWRQASSSRPAVIIVDIFAETDGTTSARVEFDVDEDGGTTADYSVTVAYADDAASSGYFAAQTTSIPLKEGAQWRLRNVADPNNGNSVDVARRMIQ